MGNKKWLYLTKVPHQKEIFYSPIFSQPQLIEEKLELNKEVQYLTYNRVQCPKKRKPKSKHTKN